MGKFLPDRKWWSSGIAGVLAFGVTLGASRIGIVLDPATALALGGLVMSAVYYLTPQSVDDILKRVDGKIIAAAAEQKPETITAAAPAIAANPAIPLVAKS